MNSMNQRLIYCILFLSSCAQSHDFTDIQTIISNESKAHKIVYISGLDYATDSLYKELSSHINKSFKQYDFYVCDSAMPDTRAILQSFSIDTLPAIIRLSCHSVAQVYNPTSTDLKSWLSQDIVHFSNSKQNFDFYRLRLYFAIKNNDLKEIESLLIELEEDDTFYSLYLRYNAYMMLDNQIAYSECRDKAISSYIQNPERRNGLLFRELIEGYQTEYPIVLFNSLNVNLGNLTEVGQYSYSIKYKNISDVPFIIVDAISSCGCIEVKYNRILGPYEESSMEILYNLEEKDLGKQIDRHVQLITNLNPSYLNISICGTFKSQEHVKSF